MSYTPKEILVTLANGTQVPWTEFKTWNAHKQRSSLVTLSEEARAKISAANKGRKATPEARAKISAAHKGKKRTAEHRAKISAAQKGKKHTPETRDLFRIVNAGRKISPEHRAKIVASVSQPIVLPVGGQFDSIRKANDWLQSQGVGNGLKKITKWLKTHPDQVYYLPKDTK
jgi:hypothetical protein